MCFPGVKGGVFAFRAYSDRQLGVGIAFSVGLLLIQHGHIEER
jgi:hypothetical protein